MRSFLPSCTLGWCLLTASAAFAQPCEVPPVVYPGLWQSGWVPGEPGSLQVFFETEADLTFQWRRDGLTLSDDDRVTGTRTGYLYVTLALTADDGMYDVVVANACGPTVSDAAEIVVSTDNCFSNYCWCDINQDGGIDGGRCRVFLQPVAAGPCVRGHQPRRRRGWRRCGALYLRLGNVLLLSGRHARQAPGRTASISAARFPARPWSSRS